MNKFTKKTNPSEDGAETGRKQTPWVAGLIFKMALIMSIIFAAFCARLHLNDKTEQLAREASEIRKQIEEKQKEIKMKEFELAQLKSRDNINAKIREHNLALRAVNPSQVRHMKRFEGQVSTPSLYGGDTRVADTSANAMKTSAGGI
jgi:cell division protein FtsL